MPRLFHTIVEGMQGVGESIVPEGGYPADEPADKKEITGGAYTGGLRVNAEIREQIEGGSGSNFFYFTEVQGNPGMYDMHPRIPEYGCEGPGKPVFKLRVNNNRFMKGVAKKFLGPDGKVDITKGEKFIQEFSLRFGMMVSGSTGRHYCPEMPMESDPEVIKDSAMNWLCAELEIPLHEKADFKAFLSANISKANESKTYGVRNFIDIWRRFSRNTLALDMLGSSEDSPYKDEKKNDEHYQNSLKDFEKAVQELNDIAGMDPESEMRMLSPTDCEGSVYSHSNFVKLSKEADLVQGKPVTDLPEDKKHFRFNFANDVNKLQGEVIQYVNEIDRLNKAAMKEKDPLKLAEIEEKTLTAQENLKKASIAAANAPDPNTLKWDFHDAPIVGSFESGGKTYYLTTESFAQESDSFVEHPGVTFGVSIGVYSSFDDFKAYYRKDTAVVKGDDALRDFVKAKEKYTVLANADLDNLTEEEYEKTESFKKQGTPYIRDYARLKKDFEDGVAQDYTAEGYAEKKNAGERIYGAGSAKGLTNDLLYSFSESLREAAARRSGVPEELREQYDRFLSFADGLLNKNIAYNRAWQTHIVMEQEMKLELNRLKDPTKYTELTDKERADRTAKAEKGLKDIQAFIKKNGELDDILEYDMTLFDTVLKCMVKGGGFDPAKDLGNEIEVQKFKQTLKRHGFDENTFTGFANDVSLKMDAAKEFYLDIQAADPGIVQRFIAQKDVTKLSQPELEFARQNLNVAINAVFTPKIREAISAHGEDIYDHIHLGGVSAKTYFGDRFNDAENSEDLKKAEILKFIVNGGEVKIDLYNEKGELENIDCRAVSQDTAITALMQGNAGQPAAEEKEKLSEIFKQAVTFREQSFVREVDAGSDPEGYIELQKQKRAAGRKVEFLEAAIFSVDMNLADATDCLKRAVGEADAQKYIDDLYTESNFRIRVGAYIEKNKPELLQGMSKLEKSQFSTSLRIFNNRMTAWREQGLITQKEHDELVRQHVVFHGRALTGEQQTRFIDAVESKLSPKALEGIRKTIDSYKDVNEFSFEESVDNEQAAKIDALKNAAAAAGKKNEEYLAALEYASKHLVSQKPKVRQEKMEFDKDVAHLANLQSDNALNVTAPVYQNGKFSGIHTETEALQDLFVVKPGRENDFKDVMETDMTFSQTTKEGLLKIFRKMEEMELEAHHFAPSGEDGDKIYAFNKLWEERKAFENAINEGDEKKITDAYKAYEKTAGDMKQLFDMAKECFADDTVIHPANYDSVRNTKIPFEFTQDVRTSAQLNAVFVNYLLIKQKGLSFEQYLNAPAGTVINGIKEGIKQNSFAEKTKGLSLEESIDAMSGQGRFKNPMLGILNVAPNYMIPRVMEIPALLEKDKNIRQDNIVRSAVMCKVFANVNNSESSKYNYLTANRDNDISRRSKSRTLLNLILVSDKDRVLNSMLGSIPATDCFGSVTGPSFDTQAYIEKKPVDYEGILDRGERLIKKAREMQHGKVPGLTADEVLESMQQLYMQVMMTHSDEKDSEGYRKMREAFRRIPDRLSEEADPTLKERMEVQKEGFLETHPVTAARKIWEDIDHARGYKLANVAEAYVDLINDEAERNRLYHIKERAMDLTQDHPDYLERHEAIADFEGCPPGMTAVFGYNSVCILGSMVLGDEATEKSNEYYRDALKALKKAEEKIRDPRAKQGIADAIDTMQTDPLIFAKINAEHPYVTNFVSQMACGVSFKGNEELTQKIKKELGSVYDDMMDFVHYGHEEMVIERERLETVQRLKGEGRVWGAAEEAAYTERLKENHTRLISCYDRLEREKDPEKLESSNLGNTLHHFRGDQPDKLRNVCSSVGYTRGELKALENGWNSRDMGILGMMGALDAEIKRVRRFESEDKKAGLDEAERDFKILKDKYWNKRVENNADKLEVADAIKSFVDRHKDTHALSAFTGRKHIFENVHEYVKDEAAKTEAKDYTENRKRKENPVAYLKELEAAGDMKKFTRAFLDIKAQYLSKKYNAQISEEIRKYDASLFEMEGDVPKKGREFVSAFQRESELYSREQGVYVADRINELARDIREGRSEYSQLLGDMGKDYRASMEVAKYLVSGNDENTCVLTGFALDKDGHPVLPVDETFRQMTVTRHNNAYGKISAYMEEMTACRAAASDMYLRLTELKNARSDNSKEFMAMYNALGDVCATTGYTSPYQFDEVIEKLDKAAAEYYKAKRIDSSVAGRRGNGLKRVEMSEEIRDFVTEHRQILSSKKSADIDLKESIGLQAEASLKIKEKYAVKEAKQEPKKAGQEPRANAHADRRRKMEAGEIRDMVRGQAKAGAHAIEHSKSMTDITGKIKKQAEDKAPKKVTGK